MIDGLIDLMISLTSLMEEESEALALRGRHPDLATVAAAKARLVAAMGVRTAELERTSPDWIATLDADAREQVTLAVGRLRDAARVNADVIRRQIDLSTEMMIAVTAEAQRLGGVGSTVYGGRGQLSHGDQATPIAINKEL